MNDKTVTTSQLVNIGTTGDVGISLDHSIYNSYSAYRSPWSFTREEDNIIVRNTVDTICDRIPIEEINKYFDIITTIEDNVRRINDMNFVEQCLISERIDDESVVMSMCLIKKKLTLKNNSLRNISNDYLRKYPMIREYIKCKYPNVTFDNSEPWSSFSVHSVAPPHGKLFYMDYNFLYPSIFTEK